MAGGITVRIDGLDELRAKLNSNRADVPVRRFLDRGAIFIQSRARAFAPVDTGRYRNSISYDSPTDRSRRIGPNVFYGPFIEFGTRAHWPPPGAMAGWAQRHGMTDYQARLGVARGGTKAHRVMGRAAEAAGPFLTSQVPVLAAELEAAYARGD